MRKILVKNSDGTRNLIEVGEGGGISVDSDTGLPILEILWDEGEEGEEIPQEIIDNLDGAILSEIDVPGVEPVLDKDGNPTFDINGNPITIPTTLKKKILEIDNDLKNANIAKRETQAIELIEEAKAEEKREAKDSAEQDLRHIATIKALLTTINKLETALELKETNFDELKLDINEKIDAEVKPTKEVKGK